MLSYASDKMEKIEWLNYGFEYEEGTKSNSPIILSDNISTKQRPLPPENDPPQKRSKLNPKSKEQIEILEKEFLNCNYLNDKSLEELINITGLAKAQIQDWFSRKRWNSSNKENIQPAKIPRFFASYKFKYTSSNSLVTSLIFRVTSSNPQVLS